MIKPILDVLAGKKAEHVPIWLMRQAGRYLPEYRELRSQTKGFLELCLTPKLATEITLQPIRRFGFDAAILFADILLIPHALGQKLEFREGEGPVLEQLENLSGLKFDIAKLANVFETVGSVKTQLPEKTTLIGFCGAPWTVAAYMIDGNSRTNFTRAKQWASEKPELLEKLIAILIDASEAYLGEQIKAGAEVLQLFESWAGSHQGADFDRWIIEPTKILVGRMKKKYPHVPIIGFPREAGEKYKDYAANTGVDAVSIDQHVKLEQARELQKIKILQGNLDPAVLVTGGEKMKHAALAILEKLGPRHIFNLGHGVVPQTPPEHVAALVKIVHGYRA